MKNANAAANNNQNAQAEEKKITKYSAEAGYWTDEDGKEHWSPDDTHNIIFDMFEMMCLYFRIVPDTVLRRLNKGVVSLSEVLGYGTIHPVGDFEKSPYTRKYDVPYVPIPFKEWHYSTLNEKQYGRRSNGMFRMPGKKGKPVEFHTLHEMCAYYKISVIFFKVAIDMVLPIWTIISKHNPNLPMEDQPRLIDFAPINGLNAKIMIFSVSQACKIASPDRALTPERIYRYMLTEFQKTGVMPTFEDALKYCTHNRRARRFSFHEVRFGYVQTTVDTGYFVNPHTGKKYRTFSRMCAANGQLYRTVYNAIKNGKSLADALDNPVKAAFH